MDKERAFGDSNDTKAMGLGNRCDYALYTAINDTYRKKINAERLSRIVKLGPDGKERLHSTHKRLEAKKLPTKIAKRFTTNAQKVRGCEENASKS